MATGGLFHLIAIRYFQESLPGELRRRETAMIGLMNVIEQEAPPGVTVNTVFPNA
jgi:hypothetical protein